MEYSQETKKTQKEGSGGRKQHENAFNTMLNNVFPFSQTDFFYLRWSFLFNFYSKFSFKNIYELKTYALPSKKRICINRSKYTVSQNALAKLDQRIRPAFKV